MHVLHTKEKDNKYMCCILKRKTINTCVAYERERQQIHVLLTKGKDNKYMCCILKGKTTNTCVAY